MIAKKTYLATLLLITSGTALANGGTIPVQPVHTGNCYVGAAVSGDMGSLDIGQNVFWTNSSSGVFEQSYQREFDEAIKGVNGELYLGYGALFRDCFYLGLEGFFTATNAKGNDNLT